MSPDTAHQLDRLVALQEVDLRVWGRQERIQRLPQEVEAARAALASTAAEAQTAQKRHEVVAKKRREREQALQVQEDRIEKLKARVSTLKTNKEYQTHLLEIETAKEEQGRMEEVILLLMEELDVLGEVLSAKELTYQEEERRCVEVQRETDAEAHRLEAELVTYQGEHRLLIEQLPTGLVAEYDQLRVTRKNLAVVAIERGMCTGCRLGVPPQLAAEVKRREQIHRCTNCQRILYWPAYYAVEKKA